MSDIKACPFCAEVPRWLTNRLVAHSFKQGRFCPCEGQNFYAEHWNIRQPIRGGHNDD